MTAQAWLQIALYVAVLTALVPLLGAYMARVYQGEHVALARLFGPVERLVYRLCGIDPDREQRWNVYALSLLTRKEPPLTPELLRVAERTRRYSSARAIQELGYPQTPLRASLEKTYRWYVENHLLPDFHRYS